MVILTPTFCSEKCWRTPQREAPHWYVHLMDNRDFAVSCSSTSHFHLKKENILFTLKSRIKPVSRAAMGLSAIATTKMDATDQPSWGDFFLFLKDWNFSCFTFSSSTKIKTFLFSFSFTSGRLYSYFFAPSCFELQNLPPFRLNCYLLSV